MEEARMKWADLAKERAAPTANVEKVAKLVVDVASLGRDNVRPEKISIF